MESFINSIAQPLEQPLLPNPVQDNIQVEGGEFEHLEATERRSTRLADKAKSRVGKDTMQIAQDLLMKKFGELDAQQDEGSESNCGICENFSQHLPKPLTKPAMEVIGVLIEHGAKLEKKAAVKNKRAASKMAVA